MNPADTKLHARAHEAATGQLLDLGVLRLERAVTRLRADVLEGALADLRLALSHMQRAGADPLSIQHLSAVISDAEGTSERSASNARAP